MKALHMEELTNILRQWYDEEITTSRVLEMINKKADEHAKKAFDNAWSLRMNCKGSEKELIWKNWKK